MHGKATAALAAAFILGSCSFGSEALWPSLTGDEPSGTAVPIQQSAAERNPQPTLSPVQPVQQAQAAQAVPSAAAIAGGGGQTGTYVGQLVAQLRGQLGALQTQLQQQNRQLQQIRQTTTQNAQRYHGTTAAIESRLQIGTTPGNPVLVSQWNSAQAELDRMAGDIAAMNTLANQVAANASSAAYILESARAAYGISGAIEADHRNIAILEDETNRTVVLVDRLLNEINEDVSRQTAYIGTERASLTTLSLAIKNGELPGMSLGSRAYAAAQPNYSVAYTPRSGFSSGGRAPLVVIRFDRPDVPFKQALYNAVSQALTQRPDATFDVVAVAPGSGAASQVAVAQSKTKRHANDVVQALTDMGLPANRLVLSATTNPGAASNEVHVYVR